MTVTTVGSTSYVFDAMLTADHTSDAELTKYPVQTGANASYNAILKPKVLILEVAMSDAIDAYKAGMWVGNLSKSVSAWQTMVSLQAARVFLTVNTRLQTYTNMLLKSITSKDDKKTFSGGLHMVLTFEQVFTSTVAQKQISSRPNTTNSNNLAISQGASVPNSVTNNYKLPDTPVSNFIDAPDLSNSYGTTESPGLWSSNNIGTIPSTLGAPQP
ncbi:unnamed protein product [Sphagnum jensenii]|uniref:Dit-like phage tail protein N-terminal domain-containing protein n=1 Tax=Sphagnum jensenii TaxID=128206 RepID=A0ABP0V796_9BRYO